MGDQSVRYTNFPKAPRKGFDIGISHNGYIHSSAISRHGSIPRSYEPKPRAASVKGAEWHFEFRNYLLALLLQAYYGSEAQ